MAKMVSSCAGLVGCGDDGGPSVDTDGTTGAATGNEGPLDDGGTNPSGPSTDPDDSGTAPTDDGADTTGSGPGDSTTDEPVDPIDPDALDDSFDDGVLAGWSLFNDQLSSIGVEGGALHLEPSVGTVWLNDSTATLLHKPVAGDFMITAAVTARGLQNPDLPPPPGFRFGGVMVRDPSGDAENYVFIVLGNDTDPSVETKTTVDSVSEYQGPPWPGATGEVRICRVGDNFGMYVRSAGGTWELSNEFDRPDLPAHLVAGPIAYNNDATAQRARVVRLRRLRAGVQRRSVHGVRRHDPASGSSVSSTSIFPRGTCTTNVTDD